MTRICACFIHSDIIHRYINVAVVPVFQCFLRCWHCRCQVPTAVQTRPNSSKKRPRPGEINTTALEKLFDKIVPTQHRNMDVTDQVQRQSKLDSMDKLEADRIFNDDMLKLFEALETATGPKKAFIEKRIAQQQADFEKAWPGSV